MLHQDQVSNIAWRTELVPGFPEELDQLAQHNCTGDMFFRAAWYGATSKEEGRTLLLRQNGTTVAAIPTCLVGPALVGARKVPGPYWPHRGVVLSAVQDPQQLLPLFKGRGAHALSSVWRLGPVRSDDPSAALLSTAAEIAGWTVLVRPAGSAWVIDLAAAVQAGWPRGSTAKRLRRYDRSLAALGKVAWHHVRGAEWNERVLEQLGQIEADSWISRETDGGDAKFLHQWQRRQWLRTLADPVLAEMLCATILMLDDRPIAFCFDLDNGPRRYGIAGSYVESYAAYHVGKMVNYRVMADAIADGRTWLDLGSGDSGYKREMGAKEAYELRDLLFVRNPLLAKVLSRAWGEELGDQAPCSRPGSAHHADRSKVWKSVSRAAGAFGISTAVTTAAIALLS